MAKKKNFFAEHWDWLVSAAGVGFLVYAVLGFLEGTGGEQTAEEYLASLKSREPRGTNVKPADLTIPDEVMKWIDEPPQLEDVDSKRGNFLSSGKRVFCQNKSCGRPIPGALKECPSCHTLQVEPEQVETDNDKDGIPNDWELKYGLNPAEAGDAGADNDADGFTNLEEYEAGTDPTDPESHPDYFDSFRLNGAVKQTTLPFVFNAANPIRDGKFRYTFILRGKKSAAGASNKVMVLEGEEIGKTGYVVGAYTPKTVKEAIAGSKGATKERNVSTIEVVRKSDNRTVVMSAGDDAQKPTALDTQCVIEFTRGQFGPFTVVKGDTIRVYTREYLVVSIGGTPQQPEVLLKDVKGGEQKIIK